MATCSQRDNGQKTQDFDFNNKGFYGQTLFRGVVDQFENSLFET